MLINLTGDDDRRAQALKALRSPDESRDGVLQKFVRLAALVMSFLEAWHSAGFADPVTGLPNRQRLVRDLQFLAASGDSAPRRLVLIDCIDIPHACELARSMGMGLVESLLRDVATLLPLRLRPAPDELFYTVATGRFAVLTRDDSHMNADWVAGRLEGISADPGDGIAMALSTHAGEVTFATGSIMAQAALRRAVSTLHEAIVRGVRFSAAGDACHTQDFTLMNDLATALRENNGLWLAFQPQICLHSGRPAALEILIRW